MPPKPDDLDNLKPNEVAGVAIGIVFAVGSVIAYFWWRRRRRRARAAAAAKAGDDPDDQQRDGGEGGGGAGADAEKGPKVEVMHNLAGLPGSDGSADAKAELPVPEGPRHEIDGVGKSAAAVRVELDGAAATFGPFELPATPAHAPARDLSWRTSESTFFRYTPKPSYVLGEQPPSDEEKEEKEKDRKMEKEAEAGPEAGPPTEDSVSPLSPRTNSGSTLGPETLTDEDVSPLTPAPLALRYKQSLNGVVEEQAEGGNELKQALVNSEETEMLDSDKRKAQRRSGGGAGTG